MTDDTSLLLLLGLGTTAGIVVMTVALWPLRAAFSAMVKVTVTLAGLPSKSRTCALG